MKLYIFFMNLQIKNELTDYVFVFLKLNID